MGAVSRSTLDLPRVTWVGGSTTTLAQGFKPTHLGEEGPWLACGADPCVAAWVAGIAVLALKEAPTEGAGRGTDAGGRGAAAAPPWANKVTATVD